MRKSNHEAVRALLRTFPDGATAKVLADRLGVATSSVYSALNAMADVYIDRWTVAANMGPRVVAVWCAVHVPENCPKPEKVTR